LEKVDLDCALPDRHYVSAQILEAGHRWRIAALDDNGCASREVVDEVRQRLAIRGVGYREDGEVDLQIAAVIQARDCW
jgi:hypothetical protein